MAYKDKEKQKEYQKLWYEKKKLEKGFIEKSRLRCRKYKAENKEKINAQRKIYRRDNKEKIIESQQKYIKKKRKTDVGFLIRENLYDDWPKTKKGNLKEVAKNLYSTLRKIKKSKYNSIAVIKIPNKGLGKTINDRLLRASKFK